MSGHFEFRFRFALRHDMPSPLRRSFSRRAAGEVVTDEDTRGASSLIAEYLRRGGRIVRYQKFGPKMRREGTAWIELPYAAHDASHDLTFEILFHDDEYFNFGAYFAYWLMQFAAEDGPIATSQQLNGRELPVVISKHGDTLIETNLSYAPHAAWPAPGQRPPDPAAPVVVSKNTTLSLPDTLEQLEFMVADYDAFEARRE